MQITVGQLKAAIEQLDDSLPVFFRRVAPVCGNIEEAGQVMESTYGFFGKSLPCVIIGPMEDEQPQDEDDQDNPDPKAVIPDGFVLKEAGQIGMSDLWWEEATWKPVPGGYVGLTAEVLVSIGFLFASKVTPK